MSRRTVSADSTCSNRMMRPACSSWARATRSVELVKAARRKPARRSRSSPAGHLGMGWELLQLLGDGGLVLVAELDAGAFGGRLQRDHAGAKWAPGRPGPAGSSGMRSVMTYPMT